MSKQKAVFKWFHLLKVKLFKSCVHKEKINFPLKLITYSNCGSYIGLILMTHFRSCHDISVRSQSGLWTGHSKTFFNHPDVGFVVCFRSLSCGRIDLVVIRIINYSRLPWSWNSLTPHDAFLMKCTLYARYPPLKQFHFCLISGQYFPSHLIKMFFGKPEYSLLVGSGFHSLPVGSLLPSLFLIVEHWTQTLTEAGEVCSSLHVVLGCCVTFQMSCQCAAGVR